MLRNALKAIQKHLWLLEDHLPLPGIVRRLSLRTTSLKLAYEIRNILHHHIVRFSRRVTIAQPLHTQLLAAADIPLRHNMLNNVTLNAIGVKQCGRVIPSTSMGTLFLAFVLVVRTVSC